MLGGGDNRSTVLLALLSLSSCNNKFAVLSELSSLDMEIHGFPYTWPFSMVYNKNIFKKFNYDLSVTIKQNELNFNKAKLSLNVPNATPGKGLSWRVTDILATSSVLLTFYSETLESMLDGYIKLPMYNSSREAKDLALKLLKDDIYREELSLACNTMIEEKCRFESKIIDIEKLTRVKLTNAQHEKDGDGVKIYTPKYLSPPKKIKGIKKLWKSLGIL